MKETKPRNTLISNLSEEDQHSFEIGDLKYIFETLQKHSYKNVGMFYTYQHNLF